MHVIDLNDFADRGLIRETSFRDQVKAIDLESLRGEEVLIKGCGQTPVPTWAYMMIAARVAQTADIVTFGEEATPMMLFERVPESSG